MMIYIQLDITSTYLYKINKILKNKLICFSSGFRRTHAKNIKNYGK